MSTARKSNRASALTALTSASSVWLTNCPGLDRSADSPDGLDVHARS